MPGLPNDAITPIAGQHEMARVTDGSHPLNIPKAGHMTPMETPAGALTPQLR